MVFRLVDDYPRTLVEFEDRFATEVACRTYLAQLRWPQGFGCPGCGAKVQRLLGLGSYETAWAWLQKLRRAMVRPGRDRLSSEVEVDETYVGGVEPGKKGRERGSKALVAVAAEVDGKGIGRIRLRRIPDASSRSLLSCVKFWPHS